MKTGIEILNEKEFKQSLRSLLNKAPEKAYDAILETAIEARSAAQEHIRAFDHIVTSRLINSLYIKSKKSVPNNSATYGWDGGSGNRDFGAVLQENEAAIGTNVIYADKIRKIDDYMQHAIDVAEKVFPEYLTKQINDLSKG